MELIAGLIGAVSLAGLLLAGALVLLDRSPPPPPERLTGSPSTTGTALAVIERPAARDGTIFGPAGTVGEHWMEACRRLGIEYEGAPDEGVRAAVRYAQAVWCALAGPERPVRPAAQRLAVTLVLADPALLRRAVAWDRRLAELGVPLKQALPPRDDLYARVATALAA